MYEFARFGKVWQQRYMKVKICDLDPICTLLTTRIGDVVEDYS